MNNSDEPIATLSQEERALLEAYLLKKITPEKQSQAIPRRTIFSPCPLSFAQQRLWFLDQFEPGLSVYTIPLALRLQGTLDIAVLERSLLELVRRHEALRTTFADIEGHPVQVIASSPDFALELVDLHTIPDPEREHVLQHRVTEEARRPFDLSQGPLFRASLLRVAPEDHVLLVTMHHIVSDGWSLGILFQELSLLYEAWSSGNASPLPDLPIQYADFAIWQREWLQGEILDTQLAYWKAQLAEPPLLDLPTDHPRLPVQTYRGAHQSLLLSNELAEAFKAFSQREGATLFMTLFAAFNVLLSRYTGQEDLCIGSPIANRNHPEIEGLIGFFVNTLVLRTDLSGNPTFRALLGRVRQVCLDAYAHQDLPFEKLVEELHPERNLTHHPLFQVMFALQNVPHSSLQFSGITMSRMSVSLKIAKFDLTVFIQEIDAGLHITVNYNSDLFEAATISRMVGHFQTLLEGVNANPDQRLSELPVLTETERHQILIDWNDTQTEYPQDMCVHQIFEVQVERTPDALAVVYEDQQLTYRELNSSANQLAHSLKTRGIGPEVRVGLCVERSLEMVVGILGILKAGGAYVPLDPSYPRDRLSFMLDDAQVSVLLTQQRLVKTLPCPGVFVLCLDGDGEAAIRAEKEEPLVNHVSADNLAYVMYTSGSTGRPKGSQVIHRGILRLVKDSNYATLRAEDVFLQLAPIAFDASTFEIWGALLNGARLVIMPAHPPSLEDVGWVIQHAQVSILWLTAGLFHRMVEERVEDFGPVQQLLVGGDVVSVPHVQQVLRTLPGCRLINGYGPTENTTFTCCYPIVAPRRSEGSVPIGRPIANTQVYILDRALQPVPIGVPGELYIGGDGLARDYLNRPTLTAERFLPHPLSATPGARLYKTGDLARYLPDGNIEFLGRMDHQVKIRGFRIELGEVESVLGAHPAVQETVVLAREDEPGNKRLVAYVVEAKGERSKVTGETLRSSLKQTLPEYMIPSVFVFLDVLPLTPNGKVDRNALPAPGTARPDLTETFVAPRTPVEEIVAGIWTELLGVEQVGIHDNFFALGGHSLLMTQVISQIRDVFRIELPVRRFFEHPTIAQLGEVLRTYESKPGRFENIAQTLLKIKRMSAEELRRSLQERRTQ